jgi:hypothetical protein
MADISDILEEIRDNDKVSELVFKKAVKKGYYANTDPGKEIYTLDLYESHAPGAAAPAAGAPPASPLVSGQPYTTKQLQLAKLYKKEYEENEKKNKDNEESNKSAVKGFKFATMGAVTAAVLAFGSCMMDNDKPRHYMWSNREIEQPVDAKNTYKGIATILGAGALIAAAYGITKKK